MAPHSEHLFWIFFWVCLLCVPSQIDILSFLDMGMKFTPRKNTCEYPQNFPPSIQLFPQNFKNWAEDIEVSDLWTTIPKSAEEILNITNWAKDEGYRIRASGFMHNWSPFTVSNSNSCQNTKVVLLKTTKYLTNMEIVTEYGGPAVRVQTGVALEDLMVFLEARGYGFFSTPAPGDVSIGGIIAMGGHGSGIPALGEKLPHGHMTGSFSNLILAFTAVVWNPQMGQYMLRTFNRNESDAKAFLTNLGRTFLIDVTLRVGPNYNLRCLSKNNIPASELFAMPNEQTARTVEYFLNTSGRIEVIWFPFTTYPWLKVWRVSPMKPSTSREVKTPYNYPFTDKFPASFSSFVKFVIGEVWNSAAPYLGFLETKVISIGLTLTDANDIWGLSKNLLLYIKPTTSRFTANGYALITSREKVQSVIHLTIQYYEVLLEEYRLRGEYPINGIVEIRITGLDTTDDLNVPGAESPSLSPVRPIDGHPELNTAIWFDIMTFAGTPNSNSFMKDFENYLFDKVHDGNSVVVRPEFSKGWGYTKEGPYSNLTIIQDTVPKLYNAGGVLWAFDTLNRFDPFHIFSNDLLELFSS